MEPEEIQITAEPEAEQPVAIQDPSPLSRLEQEVEAWFAEHFHNLGPDLSTALYNHFTAAKVKLIQRLAALTKED